jgi:hypothetical protein
MDPQIVSALAAWAAAGVALTGAGFQFFIGRKQANAAHLSAQAALKNAQNAGGHKVAEFRQRWIDNVIDTLCEHQSILTIIQPGERPNPEDDKKLAAAKTKLQILLNPDEPDTVALLGAIDQIDNSKGDVEFLHNSEKMVAIARRLLKREWVRIKGGLIDGRGAP